MSKSRNWHKDVFFGIHYDLHAKETDTELGRELTPDHLRERLTHIAPDWIQCDCKGHPGYTSWPTDVGSTSPGVVKDALRIHRDVTRDLGIKLGMHYSGVIDNRAIELHPEWAAMDVNGERTERATCRLSPYTEQLMIPQMLELVEKYDVDGFWVDGENWGAVPCWCDACRKEFAGRTGIQEVPTSSEDAHWEAWLDFHRDLFREYVANYADAVHRAKPDCLICSNWMYTVRQPEPMTVPVDYLSGDYTPNWGAARAALEGRMLDNRGVTWDLMVWGFTRNYSAPQSPWAMKSALHLKQEVSEVLALGGAVMVYAKPHRTGWLTGWEHEIIAEVADFCRARKKACFKSTSTSETAVLHVADHYYSCNAPLFNYGDSIEPLEGALNALIETGRSTDLLTVENVEARASQYRLLVVPEQTHLGETLIDRLTDWVEQGGCLLLSGAHLAAEVPDLVGCRPNGDASECTVQLPVGSEAAQVSGVWQNVAPDKDTEAVLCAVRNLEPRLPRKDTVLVTRRSLGKGTILAVHGPLFRNYFTMHFPRIRQLVDQLIDDLGIQWSVTMHASPRLELIAREKDGRQMLNLVNRGAGETLSPNRTIIEELAPVNNAVLKVRSEKAPSRVTLQPENIALESRYAGDTVTVRVPHVQIHDIVQIDF
ncbi:MAG: alpha-L-fucosidase [Candidatus Pacebacteria bacterium]|nr:alpha-L-fucosidase [Candidatus Paceibacterota bacterium]